MDKLRIKDNILMATIAKTYNNTYDPALISKLPPELVAYMFNNITTVNQTPLQKSDDVEE